jgi:RpiB/LacA/LacB family sugar-phosphate isomerase
VSTEAEVRELVARVVDEVMIESRPDAETIAVGADHGGFALKQELVEHLRGKGLAVHDCGCTSTAAVDYPDFAHAVANLVGTGVCRSGIVVDGAGIGSAMVANKVPGVRAALCYDLSSARNSREHNHANVLTLGAGLIGPNLARQIVDEWLATPWGPDRHARRVAKITGVEKRYLRSTKEGR